MTNSTIIKAFSSAALRYDQAAEVQRTVAQALARRIVALPVAPNPQILEIGCGTGFLHDALSPLLPGARWLCTDIAEAMVRQARSKSPAGIGFAVMDGEVPCLAESARFDLICASLAFQWFRDPAESLPRLASFLRPGGFLAFSALGADTFREWRRVLAAHDLPGGVADYPSAAGWRDLLPRATITEAHFPLEYRDGRAFLQDLKAIGASTPTDGYRSISAGQLRRVLRGIASPFTATYHVVFAISEAAP